MALESLCKPVIGVVHLPPLPGTPGYGVRSYPPSLGRSWSLEEIIDHARSEARAYEEAGFDAVIIENFGDTPYPKRPGPLQVASMAVIAREVSKSVGIPVGVNMLRNGSVEGLAAAYASGASFIRVNSLCEARLSPEGIIEPEAHRLAHALSLLRLYDSPGRLGILADIDVKHSTPLTDVSLAITAADCLERSGVPIEAIVITGPRTGVPPDIDHIVSVKNVAGQRGVKVIVGSGVSQLNIQKYWALADGFIVGSNIKLGGEPWNPVEKDKARMMASLASRLRKTTPECRGQVD